MIDTAGSLCNACTAIREVGGANKIYGCASHGVLSGPALERIENSYFEEVRILDTIPMPKEYTGTKIAQLSVAEMFAEAITRIDEETSISSLF
jgi:ribose-phosphate pyrophosphokinase